MFGFPGFGQPSGGGNQQPTFSGMIEGLNDITGFLNFKF